MVEGNRVEPMNAWNGAGEREIGGRNFADRESRDCGHQNEHKRVAEPMSILEGLLGK